MKITDSKSLGQAIRARRKELNYTQAYLSEFTGLSVTFISDLERGKPTAEIEKTIRLINILGMDLLVERRWPGTDVNKSQCVLSIILVR